MSLEIFNTFVGVAGLLLAIWAIARASSAKQMAEEARAAVLARKNFQEDLDRIAKVQMTLDQAKEVAFRRQSTDRGYAQAGRKLAEDINALMRAQDSLRTGLPVSLLAAILEDAIAAAGDIAGAVETIEAGEGARNGWKDALSALQVFIPSLESERRRLQDQGAITTG